MEGCPLTSTHAMSVSTITRERVYIHTLYQQVIHDKELKKKEYKYKLNSGMVAHACSSST